MEFIVCGVVIFAIFCFGFDFGCGNGRCDKQKQEWVNNDENN